MNILVTGGAGYIGSVVVEELLNDGRSVVVLDDLSKGHRDSVHPDATFVEGDIADQHLVERTLRDHGIDAVVHMAASSLVGESLELPEKYYENNVAKGLKLLGALAAVGVDRFVFSSTAAVYGEPQNIPILETDRTVPTNPYGKTKLAFERELDRSGLKFASLRYFNAAGASGRYGERHDPETHLIPLVLEAASGRIDAVNIFGDDYPTRDGTCVRDYIHVVDLARAHILALDALSDKNKIYNLGCGGGGFTVREVIGSAREVTGREIPVKIGPRRGGDPAVLVASSEKISSELGWAPQFQDLKMIIESAWKWMNSYP